ncbi:MAG: hypothetical protein K2P99_04760 [Burkholderiales bacterium]|nr:hypothetical protein [Burkholderiales bacterium]
MHNLHFIITHADYLQEAISEVRSYLSNEYNNHGTNEYFDDFGVVSAFNLNNPVDFGHFSKISRFGKWLGDNPELFLDKVKKALNSDIVPFSIIADKLKKLTVEVCNPDCNIYEINYTLKQLAIEVEGNYLIYDLRIQEKYEYVWNEVGLTNIGGDSENMYLVLVDFHS